METIQPLKPNGDILVVDDNPKNLKLLENMLVGAGYKVRPAISGAMAFKACDKKTPDLILLDINMPDINGYDVCRRLKSNELFKDIPIIFISAFSETSEKLEAFGCGGVDYITKPFQLKEVQARVKTHLSLYKMQKELERMNLQLKHKVEESDQQYRNIFNATKEIITIYDVVTGMIIDGNKAMEELLGCTRSEFMNQKAGAFSDGTPPYTQKEFLTYFEKAVSGKPQVFEWLAKRKDGKRLWLEASLTKSHIGDRKIVIIVARDISERKKAESEKKVLEKQVREIQKMEAIGTLASGISHDFNNILTAILGFSELAQDHIKEDDEAQYHIQEIQSAGFRARDLVSQILLFSRQQEAEKKPVKVSIMVKEVSKLLRASMPSYIEILLNISASKDTVMAEPTQIHQVLMNLCTNAGHAIGKKAGTIHISLSEQEIRYKEHPSHTDLKEGPYLVLEVEDTGHGISSKHLERIFEPFFTTKEKEEGTGLGLAVVHGIIKNHKGKITVSSEVGKGSLFQIYLPQYVSRIAEKPDLKKSPLPGGDETILYVDDEPPLARLGELILGKLGYHVETQTESLKALDIFKSNPGKYDLVILDRTMPKMTGIELGRKMLSIRPDIPIIICSGFSDEITREEYQRMGFKTYLNKPLVSAELAQAVHKVFIENDE